MVNPSLISRLSHAVDEIEQRSQQIRPWKVVTVRRGLKEDPDAACERHYAAHPEDRGANVVIFEFYDDEELADEGQDYPPAGPACERRPPHTPPSRPPARPVAVAASAGRADGVTGSRADLRPGRISAMGPDRADRRGLNCS
jgi:hypothetical protein